MAGFVTLQRKLIYRPTVSLPLSVTGRHFDPHLAHDVVIESHDGLKLHGWWIESANRSADASKWLVIYFPGNAENRDNRRNDLIEVAHCGFDVLIVDYRGYGENDGAPSEARIRGDAQLIWNDAIGRLGYRPDQIVIFGESLGGAVAIRLAADLCRAGDIPAGLVVTSTFASLADVAASSYPAFPFRYLLFDTWDSQSQFADVRCPVTVIHGTEDEFIPIEQGRRLFAAAREQSDTGQRKTWCEVPRMGHNDIPFSVLKQALIRSHSSSPERRSFTPLPAL